MIKLFKVYHKKRKIKKNINILMKYINEESKLSKEQRNNNLIIKMQLLVIDLHEQYININKEMVKL